MVNLKSSGGRPASMLAPPIPMGTGWPLVSTGRATHSAPEAAIDEVQPKDYSRGIILKMIVLTGDHLSPLFLGALTDRQPLFDLSIGWHGQRARARCRPE